MECIWGGETKALQEFSSFSCKVLFSFVPLQMTTKKIVTKKIVIWRTLLNSGLL